jgi:UDP-3-O-[3-hydroxymyristoyl] glucosamine N-acyltransferase
LAALLELAWVGRDLEIDHVGALIGVREGGLCFSKSVVDIGVKSGVTVIAPPGSIVHEGGAVIEADRPRLAFARALQLLSRSPGFSRETAIPQIGTGAVVSDTAVLGHGVVVGDRSFIGHHVVIADGVQIGNDCIIKSNTVIGEPGFGFERDEGGTPVRLMHLGGVRIGHRVELGSLNTVCCGTLGDTIIEDDVKTDDHVHIAHNCRIRRGALITACAELSGGVDVGELSWIGPNSSIIQKATLGKGSFVGIAANVTKSVPEGAVVAGNPARVLRNST